MNLKHIAILGYTGTGKTTVIKELIKNITAKVIIFDIERDYDDIKAHSIHMHDHMYVKELLEKYDKIRILTKNYDKKNNDFSQMYKYIFQNIRNIVFVIDEVHRQGGKEHNINVELENIITAGRKRNIKCIIASVTPSIVAKILLKSCGIIIMKKAAWTNDWDVYKKINKKAVELLQNSTNDYATIVLIDGKIQKTINL